jgi:hypothetical protein
MRGSISIEAFPFAGLEWMLTTRGQGDRAGVDGLGSAQAGDGDQDEEYV